MSFKTYSIQILLVCELFFSVECQPGEYPNASDTTQCIPCEIGFYKDVAGAMNCTQCQPNFSTVETGSNDTLLCHGKLIQNLCWWVMKTVNTNN